MARLDELAEGIAKVLNLTAVPEPLPIDLVAEGQAETTVLVRAIIDASRRREAPLCRICLDPRLGSGLLQEHGGEYEGVTLEADERLKNRVEIWRFPED
jgi:hypothetical protein